MAVSLSRRAGLLLATLVFSLLTIAPTVLVRAQSATPAASPAATDPVPCTTLFGIENPANACVLIIHAAPDAGPVDVYIDGELALAAAEFGILGDFLALPAGEHQVQVTAAGGDPAAGVINAALTVEAGVAYEVAAVGLVDDYQLLSTAVDTSVPDLDTARVQVIHAGPDAPAVDVAITGGDMLVSDVPYLSLSEPLAVPAGLYDLEVRPTGTDEVVVGLPSTELAPGTVYSFYAIGLVADGSLGVFVVPVQLPLPLTPAATPTA